MNCYEQTTNAYEDHDDELNTHQFNTYNYKASKFHACKFHADEYNDDNDSYFTLHFNTCA